MYTPKPGEKPSEMFSKLMEHELNLFQLSNNPKDWLTWALNFNYFNHDETLFLYKYAYDEYCRLKYFANSTFTEPLSFSGNYDDYDLGITVSGIDFKTPVGLSAGFDKDGSLFPYIFSLGIGFEEIGSISYSPSVGNPFPRVYFNEKTKTVFNNLGLNNPGLDYFWNANTVNLEYHKLVMETEWMRIGLNLFFEDTDLDKVKKMFKRYMPFDYVVFNLSCPNKPDEWSLLYPKARERIKEVLDIYKEMCPLPLFIKVNYNALKKHIIEIFDYYGDGIGLIFGNSVPSKMSIHAGNKYYMRNGAVTGQGIERLLGDLNCFHTILGKKFPIIFTGGVSNGQDAYKAILNGASLVGIHTALYFNGPYVVNTINMQLTQLLIMNGFKSVSEAVGSECKPCLA